MDQLGAVGTPKVGRLLMFGHTDKTQWSKSELWLRDLKMRGLDYGGLGSPCELVVLRRSLSLFGG